MIKTATVAAVALLGLLVPSASAAPIGNVSVNIPDRPPACTSPAVVNDGLIEVRCFPVIPAKQVGNGKFFHCRHVDAWTTGHSIQVVNGQTYRITQRVRDDVWICKS